ncbi:MAG: methionine--tRNA ligase [Rickettsiaceae bacterium]|nr:methionine--tRNA ligase [Rickettsiaceae bacterium]
MKNYYITTPIYYVNDVPHIGHAYTTILSDVIARFKRLSGENVKFVTGTDEHGQKIEKAAIAKNIDPKAFVDEISFRFKELCSIIQATNDDFIRTSEDRHKKAATIFWQKLEESGNIYKGKYSGWYSVRDEAYYTEDELTPDGLGPTGSKVEWMEEDCYFFALSKWQDKLLEFYEANENFILPKARKNEVISFVKRGLVDLAVSRTGLKWGIEVPGDKDHTIYVWLDALVNYLSAAGYPDDLHELSLFWPCDLHMIGKDIIIFHAVYWPAFLMAAGIKPPKRIFAHGWWTNEGQKISKSLGNIIDPLEIIEKHGSDYFRYYVTREVIAGNDGNYSPQAFAARINSELANKVGNLVQRVISFVNKNLDSKVPDIDYEECLRDSELIQTAYSIFPRSFMLMQEYEINKILDLIINFADDANIYIDKEAPWVSRKNNFAKMKQDIYILIEAIRVIAVSLQPFVPIGASKILDIIGIKDSERSFEFLSINYAVRPGQAVKDAIPVFKRIEENV